MPAKCAIKKLEAREVFDSRGVPTIEVEVLTSAGKGRNAAPFGAPGSRGEFEAPAYGEKGVSGAVKLVTRELAPLLIGRDASDTSRCDAIIKQADGTANFSRLGGNTASALSIAIARAAADSLRMPLYQLLAAGPNPCILPLPLGNIIGGGAHSKGPTPDMQEHLALPLSARTFREAVQLNILLHEETGRLLEKRDKTFTGGCDDERAWAADLDDSQALEVLTEACRALRKKTGARFRLGLDLAADRLWNPEKKRYVYTREGQNRDTAEQIAFVEKLVEEFDLCYVEDAFNSRDYQAFAELSKRVGKKCLVCGDDLLATNKARTAEAARKAAVRAMVIKVNQIGTLTAAGETNAYAQSQALKTVISHRSGETEDDTLGHLGVGWGCSLIKTGVLGGERLAKLNELIRIEEGLVKKAALASLDNL